MKRTMPAFLFISVSLGTLMGHEVWTHERITEAAVAYLRTAYPTRPLLASAPLSLDWGSVHEDDGFGSNVFGYNPYGRFIFHFLPALNNTIQLFGEPFSISANSCSSVGWAQNSVLLKTVGASTSPDGESGCSITCSSPVRDLGSLCEAISGELHTNTFTWDQDLASDDTGAPSAAAVKGIGYVLHLLEDLGSPPHTRNDAHPCFLGKYCDQFEKYNNNEVYGYGDPQIPFPYGLGDPQIIYGYGDPQNLPGDVWSSFLLATTPTAGTVNQVIPTSGYTNPTEFFSALQQYTSYYYYSNRTVFSGAGQTPRFADGNYFYGSCIVVSGIPVSQIAGTCQSVKDPNDHQMYPVRKIAHKSAEYYSSCPDPEGARLGTASEMGCDATKADIDQTIAREQFAELGPVIAQHVAAFIQFYAPALTVQILGAGNGSVTSSPGNGINCSTGTCTALFIQASQITLTAQASTGSKFAGWSGDCTVNSVNPPTAKVTLTADKSCTATFSLVSFSATVGSPDAAHPLYVHSVFTANCVGYPNGYEAIFDSAYTAPGFPQFTAPQIDHTVPLIKYANGTWQPESGSHSLSGTQIVQTYQETVEKSGVLTVNIDYNDVNNGHSIVTQVLDLNSGIYTATVTDHSPDGGSCSNITETETATAQLQITLQPVN